MSDITLFSTDDEQRGFEEQFYRTIAEIPFGNSRYQIERFVLGKETDTRTYRQICLQMEKVYQALKAAQFRRRRLTIELRKSERQRDQEKDPDERELLQITIEEKLFGITTEDKLIHDALQELSAYSQAFDAMPKFTRDEFEKKEEEYYRKRAVQQAQRDLLAQGTVSQGNVEMFQQIGLPPYRTIQELKAIVSRELTAADQLPAGSEAVPPLPACESSS